MKTSINWIQPTILKQSVKNNVMSLEIDWNDGGMKANITISRTNNGFFYNDPGNFNRKFVDAECLRWEFELPQSLVPQLEALPIGEADENTYVNFEAANEYIKGATDFDKLMMLLSMEPQEPYVNENKVGRNEPCPCGSGKKSKKCCH